MRTLFVLLALSLVACDEVPPDDGGCLLCDMADDRLVCLEAVPDGYRDGSFDCTNGRDSALEGLPTTDRAIGYRWGYLQGFGDHGCAL